jgi:hypothetical protein
LIAQKIGEGAIAEPEDDDGDEEPDDMPPVAPKTGVNGKKGR